MSPVLTPMTFHVEHRVPTTAPRASPDVSRETSRVTVPGNSLGGGRVGSGSNYFRTSSKWAKAGSEVPSRLKSNRVEPSMTRVVGVTENVPVVGS